MDPSGNVATAASTGRPTLGWGLVPWLVVIGFWANALRPQWRDLVEFQHGWLVFPLAAYLAWERFERLGTGQESLTARRSLGPTLLALAGAGLLAVTELYRHAVGLTASTSFGLSLGCAAFLFAGLWRGLGWAVARRFLLPLLFVFTAVPLPKIFWNPVVLGLQGWVTAINLETLHLLGIPAVRQGYTLQLATGTVGVDEACSGIRSLQATVMVALFVGDLTLRRPATQVAFLLVGLGLAFLGNVLRSLALSLTAAYQGVAALERWHDATGWTVLVFTLVGLAGLAAWIARTERRRLVNADAASSSTETVPREPVAAVRGLVPGTSGRGWAVVSWGAWVGAVVLPWAWFFAGAPVARESVRLQPRATVRGWSFVAEPVSATAREILATTNLLQGHFLHPGPGVTRVSVFAAEWRARDGQAMGVVQHTPDICWVGGGWVPVALGQPERSTLRLGEVTLPFECRAFAAPGGTRRELVLWCTLVSGAPLAEQDRWAMETDARQDRQSRLDWVGRRTAVNQFLSNLAARRPATGEKQFVRLSVPVQENWGEGLERLRAFATEWLAAEHQIVSAERKPSL